MNSLRFELSPSSLDVGTREERATFGQFSVVVNESVASEGVALGSNELLPGPYVPGYHVADWLVRNWWRLAYEPSLDDDLENTTMGWDLAHRMSTIGEGYVWPNILLVSDGLRMTLTTVASQDSGARAFRYVGPDKTQVVDLEEYLQAVQSFLSNVVELTKFKSSTSKPSLHDSWDKLQTEIGDSKTSTLRRIEAMLGYDPGEANEKDIQSSIDDMRRLGNDAVAELAADANTRHNSISRAKDVSKAARRVGFDGKIDDAIRLESNSNIQSWGECDAWRIGVATAHAVRHSERLNGQPIGNTRLASMAGTSQNVISTTSRSSDKLSFVIKDESSKFRIAMRSRWETGRRFDVARLVADRLFDNGIDDALLPATQAYTYRQKAQRAFAAELLAPFDALEDFLSGDRSEERRNEAADHFNVSTYVISGVLQNNLRLQ
ncbi:MAG: hypothetical protein OXG25_09960 [Gammaproteobacteria bacterium]|nr:hypothetical protein [Gammaproteobacteria bacterium]